MAQAKPEDGSGVTRVELKALLPGALMFRVQLPAGAPDTFNPRAAQIWKSNGSASLTCMPDDERSAVIQSLWNTHERAVYHYLRFRNILEALDSFRSQVPGDVFWDALTAPLHFELQALCGAARTCLDEVVYIAARRHGVTSNKAKREPWVTNKLIKEPLPAVCDASEVKRLRSRSHWYDTLNAYRNSAYHHGSRFGGGHYSFGDKRQSAKSPSMNALLLPDASCLLNRKKPFEWTWTKETRADAVAELVHTGLDDLIREIAELDWQTPEPPPGTAPRDEHPTTIVKLSVPVVLQTDEARVIALFSSRAAAEACDVFNQRRSEIELTEVPVSSLVVGKPAMTFCLRGLKREDIPSACTHIQVLIDPVPKSADWMNIEAVAELRIVVDELFEKGPELPISIPVNETVKSLYMWQKPDVTPWL
jgi:hypothetical protein